MRSAPLLKRCSATASRILSIWIWRSRIRSHRQAVHDADNERLEFLGDRVLGLVASERLCRAFPHWDSGQLSKGLARLVNASSISEAAKKIGVGAFLRLGPGEEKTGGRDKKRIARGCVRSGARRDLSGWWLGCGGCFCGANVACAGARCAGGGAGARGSQIGAAGMGAEARASRGGIQNSQRDRAAAPENF